MSKTIWKYTLPRDGQTLEIHERIVEVLHIAAQDGVPTLWAIVDPDRPRDGYTEIVAWGTGWPLPEDVYLECDYWGSCGDAYGYIWHYFAAARFPDCCIADKATNTWDSNKYGLTGYPSYSAPTITISCDNNGAIDGLICNQFADQNPTISVAGININGAASCDGSADINYDKLIGMIEKYVSSRNTATSTSVQ